MSLLRLVQKGQGPGPRPLVFLIFTGDTVPEQRARILDALGPTPCIVATDTIHPPVSRDDLEAFAKVDATKLVLVGYSAGGHGVRDLAEPLGAEIVVVADGTHSSLPGHAQTMPLDRWQRMVDRARRGDIRFATSHTFNTYTETDLGPGCYRSTVSTLRLVTGLALPMPDGDEPLVVDAGGVAVESYRSTRCDKAAHAAQVTKALPRLLSTYVRPLLEASTDLVDVTLDAGRRVVEEAARVANILDGLDEHPLGVRALEVAVAELGVHEVPGVGSNPRISAYLDGAVRGPSRARVGLTDDSTSWCAAFASWCAHVAAKPGESVPHEWRASVRELVEDARASGAWRDAKGYEPKVGDLAIFGRDGQDPRKGGHGHVARVETPPDEAGAYVTIGGNESDSVKRTARGISDPTLVGWIAYPDSFRMVASLALSTRRADTYASTSRARRVASDTGRPSGSSRRERCPTLAAA